MAGTVPEPRLAATLLLIRDRAMLEVLMVARHYQIDFASGALVFPGGKTSADDQQDEWAGHVDGDARGADRTARISAIRETFEESGILLARPADRRGEGAPLVGPDIADRLGQHREHVDRGETSFLDLMAGNGLVLALDALVHFGHWITPIMMPKRFDTHFYVAAAPDAQLASHDGRETTDALWLNPSEALEREARGEATIIFPTRLNLRKLACAESVGAALRRFSREPVITVLPQVGTGTDGKPCLRIPEVAGYGQTTEPLERIRA